MIITDPKREYLASLKGVAEAALRVMGQLKPCRVYGKYHDALDATLARELRMALLQWERAEKAFKASQAPLAPIQKKDAL